MTTWPESIRATWDDLRGWPAVLLVAWLAGWLSMPFINRVWGETGLYPAISLSVLLQASLTLHLLARTQGVRRTVVTAGIVLVLAWGLEAVGSATGFPFGAYHYTNRLRPQVAHVPLLIPVAWLMMPGRFWFPRFFSDCHLTLT